MPSPALREDATRRPDLRLGGCCVGPESWSVECVTCGQRRYLHHDSSKWATATRPPTADLVTRYAALARAATGLETAPAAVTALGIPTGVPDFVERTFRRVEITFDRPHAVIAIARGGPWEGVPIFSAWVTGE